MKRYLFLVLSAVVLAMLAAPNAFAVKIRIQDPPPSLDGVPGPPNNFVCDGSSSAKSNTPCNIYTVGNTYTVTFVGCSLLDSIGVDTKGFTSCLWMNNVTGSSVASFKFDLTVPAGAGGKSLSCDGDPASLFATVCPNTLPGDDDPFTLWFGSNPALQNLTQFFLLTDFVTMPDPAGVTVFATQPTGVPEPGELGLFGLGLLAIGAGYGLQRRRRLLRSHDAT